MKPQGRVQDILAYSRWAALRGLHIGSTWTPAQQIAWAGAMLTGPSDAADMDTLIQKASATDRCRSSDNDRRVGVSGGRVSLGTRQARK